MMNKIFASFSLVLLLNIFGFSQTKSLDDAETQIKTFTNSEKFSAVYDANKYVTKVEVLFDILKPKTPLEKQFKKFEFQLTSLFADKGIDAKPVRTTLCINTQSKKFYFLSDRNLTVSIDGETILMGEADRSTDVKGRKVTENLCWEIGKELVKELGNAASLGYEIGTIKGNFNADNIQFFKNYAMLVKVEENN